MNKPREQISHWQLLTLIVTFETGSSIVVSIGTQSKQDIWIAVLIAAALGLLLTYGLFRLLALMPGKDLFEIFEAVLGKFPGKCLTVVYLLYFLYMSSVVVRDFVELMASMELPNTPPEVVALTLSLLIAYILSRGIEVLARTAEVFLPYLMFFLLLISLLLFASGNLQMQNLEPILPDGILPVLQDVFPGLLGFPFGEMVTFALVMPCVTHFRFAGRTSMSAVAVSGLLLTYMNLVQVMTLGADTRIRAHFPLMSTVRSISVGNFIERVDALVVFITMVGIIVKSTLFLHAALLGAKRLFPVQEREIVFPFAMIVSVFSILLGPRYVDWNMESEKFLSVLPEMPLQIGVPMLLLLLVLWKSRKRKRAEGGPQREQKA